MAKKIWVTIKSIEHFNRHFLNIRKGIYKTTVTVQTSKLLTAIEHRLLNEKNARETYLRKQKKILVNYFGVGKIGESVIKIRKREQEKNKKKKKVIMINCESIVEFHSTTW